MANENAESHKPRFGLGSVIAGGIIITLGLILLKLNQKSSSSLALGKPAPELVFRWPNGEKGRLSALRGKTVLINFWASWCGPCMEEMPSLRALEQRLADKPFVLLALSIEGETGKLSETVKLPTNLIYNYDHDLVEAYGVSAVPISVLVDAEGIIRNVYFGPRNWVDSATLAEINLR